MSPPVVGTKKENMCSLLWIKPQIFQLTTNILEGDVVLLAKNSSRSPFQLLSLRLPLRHFKVLLPDDIILAYNHPPSVPYMHFPHLQCDCSETWIDLIVVRKSEIQQGS